MTQARSGRPPKLTAERQRVIVGAIRQGNTRACAAALAGIHLATLEEWLHKGKAGQEPYTAFAEAVRLADGHIEARMVGNLVSAGKSDWRAARAWLGARRPKGWGESVNLKVHRDEHDLSSLSPEELDQLLVLTEKTKRQESP